MRSSRNVAAARSRSFLLSALFALALGALSGSGCDPDYVTAQCGGGYRLGPLQIKFQSVRATNSSDPLQGTTVIQLGSRHRDIDGGDPIGSNRVAGTYIPICDYRCSGFKENLAAYRTQSQAIANNAEFPAEVRQQAQDFLNQYPMTAVNQAIQKCGRIKFDAIDDSGSDALQASTQMAHERCQCEAPAGLEFLVPGSGDIASTIQKGMQDQDQFKDPRSAAQRAQRSQQLAVGSSGDLPLGNGLIEAATAGSQGGDRAAQGSTDAAQKGGAPAEISFPGRSSGVTAESVRPGSGGGGSAPKGSNASPLGSSEGGGKASGGFGPGITAVSPEDPYALNPQMAEQYSGGGGGAGGKGGANKDKSGLSYFSSGTGIALHAPGAGSQEASIGRGPASARAAVVPMLGEDPEDYFDRLTPRDNLFKKVESRYRNLGYQWALQDVPRARAVKRAPAGAQKPR